MAQFGLKYYAQMRSRYKGVLWRVEIAQRGYSGESEEMVFSGNNPLQITWENRGDEFFVPVKASEATITIMCHENFHYIGLFTSDPRKFRVSIYRNGGLYWRGFVVADLYSESFSAPPYEVTIKAVDGFNILTSIDYSDAATTAKNGLCSLYSLLMPCIDVLELDMPLCDWLDLYGEDMDENKSPLKQTYLDMAMLYAVYEKPTFRDVLELCLRPFAAQIFQSAGTLNIRRLHSLYSDHRPSAFFTPNDSVPTTIRKTQQNVRIVSEGRCRLASLFHRRTVQDNAWDGGMYILGDNSTLEITPPIRSINVSVKNKEVDNLSDRLGFFDSDNWSDVNKALSFGENRSLTIGGDSNYKDSIMKTGGYDVEQCNFIITWEFTLRALFSEKQERTGGGYYTPRNTKPHTCTLNYGIKVVGKDLTYYLTPDGAWDDSEVDICSSVDTGTDESIKIEIDGIPVSGKLIFYIRQTLSGSWHTYSAGRLQGQTVGSQEGMMFFNMRMSIDAEKFYENGLNIDTLVNPANNVDMDISLPVCDIPAIPNDTMVFTLYFLRPDGQPTRLWHTKGKDDYMNLVEHMNLCALKFRQLPSHRLSAEILSALHLDLNSVLLDRKYLGAGFFINSLEVAALDDTHNCELVELPKLLHTETPAQGDDCIAVKFFSEECRQCVRCMNFLILRMNSGKLYSFDVLTKSLSLLYEDDEGYMIFPAENGYVRAHRSEAYYCDYRGVVRKTLDIPTNFAGFMTVRDNQWWVLCSYTSRNVEYMIFSRPEIKATYRRVAGTSRSSNVRVNMYGTFQSAIVEKNQIAINTSSACYIYDNRYHSAPNVFKVSDFDKIVAINDDYFILAGSDDSLRCCHRNTLTTYTASESFGEYAYLAALSQTKIATVLDGPALNDIKTLKGFYIRNDIGGGDTLIEVLFIYGELYLVQTNGIFKFIKQVTKTY